MFNILNRAITAAVCLSFTAAAVHAVEYTWQGGGSTDILDPANWVPIPERPDGVPPNDGVNINLPPGDIIRFLEGASRTIPNAGGRQINVASGAQILANTTAAADRQRVEAQVNIAGTGIDGNGAIYAPGPGWVLPQFTTLSGNASMRANGSARTRIDGATNRLDLQGHTLTVFGSGQFNAVGTNIYNTSGTIVANQLFSLEGTTRIDPNVTVDVGPGVLYTSWEGRSHRREAAVQLRNNGVLETRLRDRNLTFTGPVTVAAGDTGILRSIIQNNGTEAGNNVDLRLNVTGAITGAGAIRKEGNGTAVLTGNNTYSGGTSLGGTGPTPPVAGSVVAASNSPFGTGAVTVNQAAVVHIANVGSEEYRDSDARAAALGVGTGRINPTLSGLHSSQPYDQTRFSYIGKINNTTGADVVYTFAENYDDEVYLEVNGVPLLNDGVHNVVTTGQITLGPGEHDIRVSVRNGTGGAGPTTPAGTGQTSWNNNVRPIGVGISTALPLGGATTNFADYTPLGDNFEVYQGVNRTFANNFVLNAPLTLTTTNMNGYLATVSGNLTGPNTLTVQGSPAFTTDQLVLSGTNTYTGNTTVEAGGHLNLAGTQTSAAELAVLSGGRFTLTGTLEVGDTLAPNTAADFLLTNEGQAAFASSGSLRLDIFSNQAGTPASEADKLLTGGPIALTLAGSLVVSNPNAISNWAQGDTFDLFDWGTAPSGTFSAIDLPILPAGLSWNTADVYNGGTVEVVPEPTAGVLLAMLGGAALLRRRRPSHA